MKGMVCNGPLHVPNMCLTETHASELTFSNTAGVHSNTAGVHSTGMAVQGDEDCPTPHTILVLPLCLFLNI